MHFTHYYLVSARHRPGGLEEKSATIRTIRLERSHPLAVTWKKLTISSLPHPRLLPRFSSTEETNPHPSPFVPHMTSPWILTGRAGGRLATHLIWACGTTGGEMATACSTALAAASAALPRTDASFVASPLQLRRRSWPCNTFASPAAPVAMASKHHRTPVAASSSRPCSTNAHRLQHHRRSRARRAAPHRSQHLRVVLAAPVDRSQHHRRPWPRSTGSHGLAASAPPPLQHLWPWPPPACCRLLHRLPACGGAHLRLQ